jgi:uncharacterized protein (TIGR01244 family)
MLSDITNYLLISDRLATAGQPTAAQLAAIAEAGFEVVINLALPTSDGALPDERAVVESYGMTYYAIPVVWEQPTTADFQQFQTVLADHAQAPVFVHCAKNLRVSAFVYLHRCLSGESQTAAAADLAKIWHPNAVWQQFIDATLAQ